MMNRFNIGLPGGRFDNGGTVMPQPGETFAQFRDRAAAAGITEYGDNGYVNLWNKYPAMAVEKKTTMGTGRTGDLEQGIVGGKKSNTPPPATITQPKPVAKKPTPLPVHVQQPPIVTNAPVDPTDPFAKYEAAQKAYFDEQARIAQSKQDLINIAEGATHMTDPSTRTYLGEGDGKFYCATAACEKMQDAGFTVPADYQYKDNFYPAGSPVPVIPGNQSWQARAEGMGFQKIPYDQQQAGDVVQVLDYYNKPTHMMIASGARNEMEQPTYYYSPWQRDKYKEGSYPLDPEKTAVWRYMGNLPKYQSEYEAAKAELENMKANNALVQKVQPRGVDQILPDMIDNYDDTYAQNITQQYGGQPQYKGGGWIQGAVKRPGAFTAKANAAGMGVQEYANHVLREGSHASTRTKRQAALAKTFKKMAKKQFGGSSKAPQNVTQDGIVQYKQDMFKNKIAENTYNALAAQEADTLAGQMMNFMQYGGTPKYPYGGSPSYGQVNPWLDAYGAMKTQHQDDFNNFLGTSGEMTAAMVMNPNELKLKKVKTRLTDPSMRSEYKDYKKQMKAGFQDFQQGDQWDAFNTFAQDKINNNQKVSMDDMTKFGFNMPMMGYGGYIPKMYPGGPTPSGDFAGWLEQEAMKAGKNTLDTFTINSEPPGSIGQNVANMSQQAIDDYVRQQWEQNQTPPIESYNAIYGNTPANPFYKAGDNKNFGDNGPMQSPTADPNVNREMLPVRTLYPDLPYNRQIAPIGPEPYSEYQSPYPPYSLVTGAVEEGGKDAVDKVDAALKGTGDSKTGSSTSDKGSGSGSGAGSGASSGAGSSTTRGNYVDPNAGAAASGQGAGTQGQYVQGPNGQIFVTQPGAYGQGYNLFPSNRWQRGPGATGGPAIAYNPNDTYLDEYTYKGRLFGKGPRKVKMKFSHYGQPGMPGMPEGDTPPLPSPEVASRTKGGIKRDNTSGLDQNVADVDPTQSVFYNDGMSWQTPEGAAAMPQPAAELPTSGGIPVDDMAYANETAFRFGGNTPPPYPGAQPFHAAQVFFKHGGNMPCYNCGGGIPKAEFGLEIPEMNGFPNAQPWAESKAVWKRNIANGQELADWGLAGMSMLSSLGEARDRRAIEEGMKQRMMGDAVFQPVGAGDTSRGSYTVNRGDFRPDQTTPVQFQGWNQGMIGSGQTQYQQGGEYTMSDEEVAQFLAMGGQIEYID
jgi:hypothetical protein